MRATIVQRLLILVFLVAIPLVAATLVVIYELSQTQRNSERSAMLGSTRILASAIDSEIETYLAIARTLSGSPLLRTGDFREFYNVAVHAVSFWPDSWLALADADDRQLLNSNQPFETPLPPVQHLEPHRRALETRQWQISEVFAGQVSKRHVVALYVPVIVNDKAAYNVIVAIDPVIFQRLLQEQRLPQGWLSGIIDGNGNFVARTRDHENFVGRPASAGWRAAAKASAEGLFENISIEGEPLFSAFVNTRLTGWSVSLAATQQTIMAPFYRSLSLVGVIALALMSLSLFLAWLFGRRISAPLVTLQDAAKAIVRGERRPFGFTGLQEADQALTAFDAAASTILEREQQFRTLADSIPQLAWMANPDGGIFWYNLRWYEYTGTNFDQVKGWGWQSVHDPALVDGVIDRFRAAIQSADTWEDTFPLRGADGRYRWFLSRAVPVRDSTGNIVRWFGTNTDISEQKSAADRQHLLTDELTIVSRTHSPLSNRWQRSLCVRPQVLGNSGAALSPVF